ncbi:MAG: hypothetical protein ABIP20_12100 [Chthoniobacteraceae bacterium]
MTSPEEARSKSTEPVLEQYSHEELKRVVCSGHRLHPDTPGLEEAAREMIGPLIEGMKGQKIIYHYRIAVLMRVDELTVDDHGFRAVPTILHRYPFPEMERLAPETARLFESPFDFFARWTSLRLCGKAICMAMTADSFIVDQAVIAEVEAAATRGEPPDVINEIVYQTCNPHDAQNKTLP